MAESKRGSRTAEKVYLLPIPWQRELQKYPLAYRSTPHTTTGITPAELLYGRKITTKMPEFEITVEEE